MGSFVHSGLRHDKHDYMKVNCNLLLQYIPPLINFVSKHFVKLVSNFSTSLRVGNSPPMAENYKLEWKIWIFPGCYSKCRQLEPELTRRRVVVPIWTRTTFSLPFFSEPWFSVGFKLGCLVGPRILFLKNLKPDSWSFQGWRKIVGKNTKWVISADRLIN